MKKKQKFLTYQDQLKTPFKKGAKVKAPKKRNLGKKRKSPVATGLPRGFEVVKKKDPTKFKNNSGQQFIYLLSMYSVTLLTALGCWQYEIKTGRYITTSEYSFVLSIYIGVTAAIAIKESSYEVLKKDWFRKSVFVTFSLMLFFFIFMKTIAGYHGMYTVPGMVSQYIGIMWTIGIAFWLWSKGGMARSIFAIVLLVVLTSPFLWLFWIKIPPWGY